MKILDFFLFLGSFLPSWIRIRIRNLNADPDPDPTTQINADPCGSGYGSGSETLAAITLLIARQPSYHHHHHPNKPTLLFIRLEVASRLFYESFMQLTQGTDRICLLALSNSGDKTAYSLTPPLPPHPN
jgi:hypothetical protein